MPPIRLTSIQTSPRPRDRVVPEPRAGSIPAEMPCACWFLRPGEPGGRSFDRVGPPTALDQGESARRRRPPVHPLRILLVQELFRLHGHGRENVSKRSSTPPSLRRAVLKQLIQDRVEARRLCVQLPGLGLVARALLEQLVGNVERGEDRHLGCRDPGQTARDLAHLAIHVRRNFQNVGLVVFALDRIAVAEDVDLHGSPGVHGVLAPSHFPCVNFTSKLRLRPAYCGNSRGFQASSRSSFLISVSMRDATSRRSLVHSRCSRRSVATSLISAATSWPCSFFSFSFNRLASSSRSRSRRARSSRNCCTSAAAFSTRSESRSRSVVITGVVSLISPSDARRRSSRRPSPFSPASSGLPLPSACAPDAGTRARTQGSSSHRVCRAPSTHRIARPKPTPFHRPL